MNINSINLDIRHVKSLAETIRMNNKLPFSDILSPETVNEKISVIPYRARIFTPDVTLL